MRRAPPEWVRKGFKWSVVEGVRDMFALGEIAVFVISYYFNDNSVSNTKTYHSTVYT